MKVTCKFFFMNIVEQLNFKTDGYQIVNITEKIEELVHRHKFKKGLVNLSILHTSASLIVQENASKDVLDDIRTFLSNLAPESTNYLHNEEGLDDMPAHLKTLITNTNVTMSVASNKLLLGVWQGVFLCEWRKYGQTRTVMVHLLGE